MYLYVLSKRVFLFLFTKRKVKPREEMKKVLKLQRRVERESLCGKS